MNVCGSLRNKWIVGAAAGILLLASTAAYNTFAGPQGDGGHQIRHVLLISIDGMHAVDFLNCSKGINGGEPYCPNLAKLALTGVNYLDTSTSKPSDSFPGLMALVTGGSPRTYGAFYDVAYDRSLDPPALTTGNGVSNTFHGHKWQPHPWTIPNRQPPRTQLHPAQLSARLIHTPAAPSISTRSRTPTTRPLQ